MEKIIKFEIEGLRSRKNPQLLKVIEIPLSEIISKILPELRKEHSKWLNRLNIGFYKKSKYKFAEDFVNFIYYLEEKSAKKK